MAAHSFYIVQYNESLLVVATFVAVIVVAGTIVTSRRAVAVTARSIAAAIAVATIAIAVTATITTRTAVATLLFVALGLLLQGTHRQAVLAGLLINLNELDCHLVALMQAACLHVGKALPANLADVEQTVTTRHKLNESTKLED